MSHGIEPAPERSKAVAWSQFLRAHWSTIAATDFFSTEVWTTPDPVTVYTLFVIRLESRRVLIVGSTPNPDHVFAKQAAHDLARFDDSILADDTHHILDRHTKFTSDFTFILAEGDANPVVLPARSPSLNAYAVRFVRIIKFKCPSKMIFFGQASLDHPIRQFVDHHHAERNHQGLLNELITEATMPLEGESSATNDSVASTVSAAAPPKAIRRHHDRTQSPSLLAAGARQRLRAPCSQPMSARLSPDRGRSVVPAAPIRRRRSFCTLRR